MLFTSPSRQPLRLGTIAGTRSSATLPFEQLALHTLVAGQSGTGVGELCLNLATQYVGMGGRLVWVDGRNAETVAALAEACRNAGRSDEFLSVDFANDHLSNTYDPWRVGSPEERAARYAAILPTSDGNPGADFYRQQAEAAVQAVLVAAEAAGFAASTSDVALALSNPEAMAHLRACLPSAATHAARRLDAMLQGADATKRFHDLYGPLAARLGAVVGSCSAIDAPTPEIDLAFAIASHSIVNIAIPPFFAPAGMNVVVGRAVMADLTRAIEVDAARDHGLPVLCVLHDMPQELMPSIARLMTRARSRNVALLVGCDSYSGMMDANHPQAAAFATVLANAATKAFFNPGESNAAKRASAVTLGAIASGTLLDLACGDCVIVQDGAMLARVTIDRIEEPRQALFLNRIQPQTTGVPLRLAERMLGVPAACRRAGSTAGVVDTAL